MWRSRPGLRHSESGAETNMKESAMAVEALKCKECGETYPLEARFVCDICFGPLEVKYDLSTLDAGEVRRKIQSGPLNIWRYADFLPFETRPQTALSAGMTPLVRADR